MCPLTLAESSDMGTLRDSDATEPIDTCQIDVVGEQSQMHRGDLEDHAKVPGP
jgi:hypothetical protein